MPLDSRRASLLFRSLNLCSSKTHIYSVPSENDELQYGGAVSSKCFLAANRNPHTLIVILDVEDMKPIPRSFDWKSGGQSGTKWPMCLRHREPIFAIRSGTCFRLRGDDELHPQGRILELVRRLVSSYDLSSSDPIGSYNLARFLFNKFNKRLCVGTSSSESTTQICSSR